LRLGSKKTRAASFWFTIIHGHPETWPLRVHREANALLATLFGVPTFWKPFITWRWGEKEKRGGRDKGDKLGGTGRGQMDPDKATQNRMKDRAKAFRKRPYQETIGNYFPCNPRKVNPPRTLQNLLFPCYNLSTCTTSFCNFRRRYKHRSLPNLGPSSTRGTRGHLLPYLVCIG
jgi:hypothetical protein